jgi:hypothetical protein
MSVAWVKRCLIGVVVAGLMLAGCDSSDRWDRWKVNEGDLVISSIEQSGAGAGVEEEKREFKEGFVLCTGPWEVYQVWIIEGERLTGVWSDFGGDGMTWRGNQWVLTRAQQDQIARCLKGLEGKLGKNYVNERIADGLVLRLYETPDARGHPVLESSNAGIEALEELFEVLARQTGNSRMTMKAPVDAPIREIAERAVRF